MRRKDRKTTAAEAASILENGEYGVLSTVSPNGEPYGVPLNYCVIGNFLYFHCALEGRKLDHIAANPKVSFCVVGPTQILPDQFGTRYECCIVEGSASEAFGAEKQSALEGLLHKYSAAYFPEGLKYIERLKDQARVYKVAIESISGKARR
ncbi:MAG: pyridoxamine 5'-phosphate oxidase family protein [Desulfobacterales bacterium]